MKKVSMLVVLSLVALCAGAETNVLHVSLKELELFKRGPFRDQMIVDAAKVAVQSKDPEAIAIADFVRAHSALGLIHSNSFKLVEDATTNTLFALLPILPEDLADLFRIPVMRSMTNYSGEYMPAYKVAAVRADIHLSPFGQGMLVLHEGKHAYLHLIEHHACRDLDDVDRDEVEVRTFDCRVYQKIGGPAYEQIVARQMDSINQSLAAIHEKIGDVFPESLDYDPAIDSIFGKPASKRDASMRCTGIYVDVIFRLLERAYTGEALAKQKITFIRSAYEPATRTFLK